MRRSLCSAALAGALLAFAVAPAQAQFGRNKVQYRAFNFRIIKTEHFDIYFYPREREAALDAARMAERAYGRLSRLLQHEFDTRKPIILYASHSDFQQTNALPGLIDESTGGVTEILKNRVIVPLTGSYADFEHVLTHELVHAFQFDILFGDGMVTGAQPTLRVPLWFMEGMAEYLSLGRVDAHTASWLRDAVTAGYIRDIDEMNRRDDYLSYRFGQSLWAFIGHRWGDDAIGVVLKKLARMGLERAFVSTFGLTLAQLSQEWLASVRTTYLPELVQHEAPTRYGGRLTHHEKLTDPWYLAPALSPDGKLIVFASQRQGFFMDLWLADANTGQVLKRLVKGSRSSGFESLRYQNSTSVFSPDGRLVAFAAETGGRDALYVYDVRKRRMAYRLQFDLNGIENPSWSPDGRRIVFTGLDGGLSDLFVTDLHGRLQRLTHDRHADLMPSWSPDGSRIAFATDGGPDADFGDLRYGNFRIALLYVASGRVELLPGQDVGKNIDPVWSPDGRSLAWVSDRTGINNLYLYNLDDRSLFQLTDVLSGIIGTNRLTPVLSWSRAGRLAFVYFEHGGYNLYTIADPLTLPRRPVWPAPAVIVQRDSGNERAAAGVVGDADVAVPASGVGETPTSTGKQTSSAPSSGLGRPTSDAASWLRQDGVGFSATEVRPGSDGRRGGRRSLVDVLDSAGTVLPDTSAFDIVRYHVKFTPDVIGRPTIGATVGGYYGNGLYGGSHISLSDMLGDQNIVLAGNINGSLSDAVFFGSYEYLKRRVNYGVTFQQVPLYRYRGLQSFTVETNGVRRNALAQVFIRDVIRQGTLMAHYPFSQFQRLELGASAIYFKRDYLFRGILTDTNRPLIRDERIGDVAFAQPTVALVFDNALFGWTGPIYGTRYRLQVSRAYGGYSFDEGYLDFRNYWNLKRVVVLASRFVALVRQGRDADRFSLFWGGPYFIRGYDATTFDPGGPECEQDHVAGGASGAVCPARDQLIGSSAAFMNLELRFPIITELQLGFLGTFPPVDAVAFFDGGLAWDNHACLRSDYDPAARCDSTKPVRVVWRRKTGQDPYLFRQPVYSYGLGLRFNVYYAVIRLDYALPLNRPHRNGVFSVSFGPSF
jgi:Tol biopolymer transport system component